MKRPQPYRIAWPVQPKLPDGTNAALARQFQNIDEMFQILFDAIVTDAGVAVVRRSARRTRAYF